jgi:hypothetical protein
MADPKTPAEILARNEAYRQKNWDKIYARQLAWQRENKEKCNEANRKSRRRLRAEVLEAYGNKCACCGEQEEAFLEVHHINGGGNKHRKELGGGAKVYGWLKRNNWPRDFELNCSNCNKAEYNRGICPHKLKKLEGAIN